MRNKSLLSASAILFTALLTGIVYAAEAGALTFTGRVARTSILDLELQNISLNGTRFGEFVELADENKKSMHFYVLLIEPGDTRTISFNILNSGNMAAKLEDLDVVTPDLSTGLGVEWTPLDSLIIMPGESSGPFSLTVYWDISEPDLISGSYDVEVFILYSQK